MKATPLAISDVILFEPKVFGDDRGFFFESLNQAKFETAIGRHVTFVLDGNNVRHGLCGDLGFSIKDCIENIRRIGEMAKLFMEAGVMVLTAFISPYRADRERVRGMVVHGDFIEIYCDASIEVCEARDVKGMYKKARAGQIAEFTGISSPYEAPENPELTVNTGGSELDNCVRQVIDEMVQRGLTKITSSGN